ncbi:hypothetical protein DLAC_07700 [Tieghemostelium lacteum]|uniref:SnoaL-like domain-containing protein n=1 Tax=Tieghemostelium lacteum TaxID=361077 RepID=A0A151ZA65_TIELA|nr:hypothetical protein DLAC_07700 [Tieghemostelium lacteum]|eukprot:KYQ90832.1 hypothetical protein DLAC_07700 [Tieghemostelium lacteum]
MKLILSVILLLSIVSNCIVYSKSTNQTVEERVLDELKVWENNWSGFPINCRKMVDTLSSDGVVEYPVGKHVISGGHKRIYGRCEAFILENFSQMVNYITGVPQIVGHNAAFERATLFVTKNNCRFVNKGIVTINYDSAFKIKALKDYFDLDDLLQKFEQCQFPGTPLPDINATSEDKSNTVTSTPTEKPSEKTKDEL